MKRALLQFSKRTPGYVFWREQILGDLESSRRSYLSSEKKIPIGEVSRRMTSIKVKYQETENFNERTLLRGEYKYYSGKPCDLRVAHTSDMIAFLECSAFFGFWDASQVDLIIHELYGRAISGLTSEELLHLFISLPNLKKDASGLYKLISSEILHCASEFTEDECVKICLAATAETPDEVLLSMFEVLESKIATYSLSVQVQILDTLGSLLDSEMGQDQLYRLSSFLVSIHSNLLSNVRQLNALEVATVFSFAQQPIADQNKLAAYQCSVTESFLSQSSSICAKALALYFSSMEKSVKTNASSETIRLVIDTTIKLMDRIIFLCVDLSIDEITPVLRVILFVMRQQQQGSGSSLLRQLSMTAREVTCELIKCLQEAGDDVPPPFLVDLVQMYHEALTDHRIIKHGVARTISEHEFLRSVPGTRSVWELLSSKVLFACGRSTKSELSQLSDLSSLPLILSGGAIAAVQQRMRTSAS